MLSSLALAIKNTTENIMYTRTTHVNWNAILSDKSKHRQKNDTVQWGYILKKENIKW